MKKILLIFVLIPINLCAQYNYIGRIDDDCSPNFNYNYTYENYEIGSHGAGYNVYRDGVLIRSGSGDFGCCTVEYLKVFTDSIVFLVINDAGFCLCYRTIDAGNTWTMFYNGWFDIDVQDISILNKNTAFVLSRGNSLEKISILRISDIRSRYLVYSDTINTLVTDVYINDSIFGESYCSDIDTIGFRIEKDGIFINYHIPISQIPLSVNNHTDINPINIYPNPTICKVYIETLSSYNIKLSNIMGQHLQNISLKKGKNEIDLSKYNDGVYFISFYNKQNHLITKKILKR